MILYISRLFSRLTLKMNGSRGTYVNIEKICFYLFTIRFTLYVLFFFVSSILYDRYDFLFSSFFFLLTVYNFQMWGKCAWKLVSILVSSEARSSWSKFFTEKYVSRAAKQVYKILNIRVRVDREKSAAIKLREQGEEVKGDQQRIEQFADRMAHLQTICSN